MEVSISSYRDTILSKIAELENFEKRFREFDSDWTGFQLDLAEIFNHSFYWCHIVSFVMDGVTEEFDEVYAQLGCFCDKLRELASFLHDLRCDLYDYNRVLKVRKALDYMAHYLKESKEVLLHEVELIDYGSQNG